MMPEQPTDQKPQEQLHMLWPESRLASPPRVSVPAGYGLRTFLAEDAGGFLAVMAAAGFGGWDEAQLKSQLSSVLPDGLFLIVEKATGTVVATTMATHNPSDLHPYGGELGWVAGDPAHRGKGLGMAICAATTARFLEAKYRRIYLKTDDWRLPALKTYLKLGYEPFLFSPDMEPRWRAVCEKLEWPFTPEDWPKPCGEKRQSTNAT